jgi:hypothetical protein
MSLSAIYNAGNVTLEIIALAGAAGGFTSGLISTGSIRGALTGALYGGASAGMAGLIAAQSFGVLGASASHGVAQGFLSEAFGGDFKSGFIGAFVGHSVGGKLRQMMPKTLVGRTIAATVTGGTGAALGGGKFANGAVSAAFTHLFNDEVSSAVSEQLAKRAAQKLFNGLVTDKVKTLSRYLSRITRDGVMGKKMAEGTYDLFEATLNYGINDYNFYRPLKISPTGRTFYTDSIIPWGQVDWKLYDQGNAVDTIKYLFKLGTQH